MRKFTLALLPVAMLALAACGDDSGGGSGSVFASKCEPALKDAVKKMAASNNEQMKKMAAKMEEKAGAICGCIVTEVGKSSDIADADKKKILGSSEINNISGISEASKKAFQKIGRQCSVKNIT